MAYDFLKRLYGTPKEGEAPKALTFDEMAAALEADKELSVVNLKDGGYVAKGKLDDKVAELAAVREQLDAANAQIEQFKGMDIEGIKKAADDWKAKYETETKRLQEQMDAQRLASAEELAVSQYRFASPAARIGVLALLRQQGLKTVDNDGHLVGAKEFLDKMKAEGDNMGAFAPDTPAPPAEPPAPSPRFAPNGGSNTNTPPSSATKLFDFGFTHVVEPGASDNTARK